MLYFFSFLIWIAVFYYTSLYMGQKSDYCCKPGEAKATDQSWSVALEQVLATFPKAQIWRSWGQAHIQDLWYLSPTQQPLGTGCTWKQLQPRDLAACSFPRAAHFSIVKPVKVEQVGSVTRDGDVYCLLCLSWGAEGIFSFLDRRTRTCRWCSCPCLGTANFCKCIHSKGCSSQIPACTPCALRRMKCLCKSFHL